MFWWVYICFVFSFEILLIRFLSIFVCVDLIGVWVCWKLIFVCGMFNGGMWGFFVFKGLVMLFLMVLIGFVFVLDLLFLLLLELLNLVLLLLLGFLKVKCGSLGGREVFEGGECKVIGVLVVCLV